jgi:hypothetical protein
MSACRKEYVHDDAAASEHLETILRGGGPICPRCNTVGNAAKLEGKAHRIGVGMQGKGVPEAVHGEGWPAFEHARMPLHKFLQRSTSCRPASRACRPVSCTELGDHLQVSLVSGAPHPRDYAGRPVRSTLKARQSPAFCRSSRQHLGPTSRHS